LLPHPKRSSRTVLLLLFADSVCLAHVATPDALMFYDLIPR